MEVKSLHIKTESPFDSDKLVTVRFYTNNDNAAGNEAGGISLQFSRSGVPRYQILSCNNKKELKLFPTVPLSPKITTQPFIWTIEYRRYSKRVLISFNGVKVLNYEIKYQNCQEKLYIFKKQWEREKKILKFLQIDTASLNFATCKICAGK